MIAAKERKKARRKARKATKAAKAKKRTASYRPTRAQAYELSLAIIYDLLEKEVSEEEGDAHCERFDDRLMVLIAVVRPDTWAGMRELIEQAFAEVSRFSRIRMIDNQETGLCDIELDVLVEPETVH